MIISEAVAFLDVLRSFGPFAKMGGIYALIDRVIFMSRYIYQ